MNPQRILIILVARIGDTLLGTPAMRAVKARYPAAELTVLAHPKRKEVLENLTFIDRLGGITPKTACWRYRFSRTPFDLALVYGNDLALIRMAMRVSRSVVAFEQSSFAGSDALRQIARPTIAAPQHAVRERLLLAEAAGARADDLRLGYRVSPGESGWADSWLRVNVSAGAHPLIGLQLFSFPTKAHRDWPLASFQGLIERVLAHYPGAHFLVFGDQLARQRAVDLMRGRPDSLSLCAGRMTLRQTAALMARLNLYVGVDTGPTHLAGAVGVPMVALYHCAYPGRYLAPLEHGALRVIEHPLTGVSRSAEASMADIPVDEVWQAVHELLSTVAGAGGEREQ